MKTSALCRSRSGLASILSTALGITSVVACGEQAPSEDEPNDDSQLNPINTGGNTGDGDSVHSGGSSLGEGSLSGGTSNGGNTSSGGSGGTPTNGAGGTEPGEVYAFPGAEGFGRDALGGRGGEVCHVTTLADSGPGSLRDCVSQSNRTVVFDVGGWITLSSNLGITQNNLTLAGQTAPGNGIGIRGRKVSIGGSDIVLRFLRVRRGILETTARDDAMTVASGAENVIVDHCSIGFGTDENFSIPGDEGRGPRHLTVQWSIIAWGLQRNNHSAGSLLTSNETTIHHTLWAFNKTRNPRARSESPDSRGQGGHLDWVNNIIYGWNAPDPFGEGEGWSISHHPFILAGTENGEHSANAVGNYFISTRQANYAFVSGTPNYSLYFENNWLDGNANGQLDVSGDTTAIISGNPTLLEARLPGPEVHTDAPDIALSRVLAYAGVTFPARDQADALLIQQVQAQSGILIQSENDLIPLGVAHDGYGELPSASRPAGYDTDGDGMPDAWEIERALDPNDPSDRNGDQNENGYTNLEDYLNSLVPPAPSSHTMR